MQSLINFLFKIKEEDVTTDTACFSSSPFSRIVLLSVSQYHTDDHHGPDAAKQLNVRL